MEIAWALATWQLKWKYNEIKKMYKNTRKSRDQFSDHFHNTYFEYLPIPPTYRIAIAAKNVEYVIVSKSLNSRRDMKLGSDNGSDYVLVSNFSAII